MGKVAAYLELTTKYILRVWVKTVAVVKFTRGGCKEGVGGRELREVRSRQKTRKLLHRSLQRRDGELWGTDGGATEDWSEATTCRNKRKQSTNSALFDAFKHATNVLNIANTSIPCSSQNLPLLPDLDPSPPLKVMRFSEAYLWRRGKDTWTQWLLINWNSETWFSFLKKTQQNNDPGWPGFAAWFS